MELSSSSSTSGHGPDELHHFCGVTLVRLLKPIEYYIEKYGTPLYGLNKTYLLIEKQRNRGQDGAGIACVKMDLDPGYNYVDCVRSLASDPMSDVMKRCDAAATSKLQQLPHEVRENGNVLKHKVPFTGECLLGHVRYSTDSEIDEKNCHPVPHINNWLTRSIVVAGNFNLNNLDELFTELISFGQHPREKSDTVTLTENLCHFIDKENNELYAKYYSEGLDTKSCFELIAKNLDISKILRNAASRWDGGYCICGILGHGDAFTLRDPWGIRPAFYSVDDEVLVVASERPVIQSVFNSLKCSDVHELEPGHALIIKRNGLVKKERILPSVTLSSCSFERIYFSRGGDPAIYQERLHLGRNLTHRVLEACDYDFTSSIIGFVPNTAEISYLGLLQGLQAEADKRKRVLIQAEGASISDERLKEILSINVRYGKILFKDAKLRTFIQEKNSRDNMISLAYDISHSSIKPGDTLVMVDDSIVRGSTLRKALLKNLAQLQPSKIVIVSSAPQIRYPDCYGIDISVIGNLIAFEAAVSLLKERGLQHVLDEVYEDCKKIRETPLSRLTEEHAMKNFVKAVYKPFTMKEISDRIRDLVRPPDFTTDLEIIFQDIEGLSEALPHHKGYWYFTGDYPTPGGARAARQSFINWYEGRIEQRGYGIVSSLSDASSVLILGKGGAAHCLACKLAYSPRVGAVWVFPGNGGTDNTRVSGKCVKNVVLPNQTTSDSKKLQQSIVQFCRIYSIGLVVVADQELLLEGVVDTLISHRIPVFGPQKKAAVFLSEASSVRQLMMEKLGVKMPVFYAFKGTSSEESATACYMEMLKKKERKLLPLIKGLPFGEKDVLSADPSSLTVFSPTNASMAAQLIQQCLVESEEVIGEEDASSRRTNPAVVQIEEPSKSVEVSMCVFTDGVDFLILQTYELFSDYADETPAYMRIISRTGASCPSYTLSKADTEYIGETIVGPFIKALAELDMPFVGCLNFTFSLSSSPGFLHEEEGIQLVEVTGFFQEPDIQVTVPLLSMNFYGLLMSCVEKRLGSLLSQSSSAEKIYAGRKCCMAVVMFSDFNSNTVGSQEKKQVIGIDKASKVPDCLIFHNQTAIERSYPSDMNSGTYRDMLTTAGKRVLCVCGLGRNPQEAKSRSLVACRSVQFLGARHSIELSPRSVLLQNGKYTFENEPLTDGIVKTSLSSPPCLDLAAASQTREAGSDRAEGWKASKAILNAEIFNERSSNPRVGNTYFDAGVDRDIGAIVSRYSLAEQDTHCLASVFDFSVWVDIKSPTLTIASCSVGTKVKVAAAIGHFEIIGVDLVALTTNSLLSRGSKPLFFVDYLSSNKLDVSTILGVSRGIRDACRSADCTYIAGEKAELPGLFRQEADFDVCGFCVGAVEIERLLPNYASLKAGNVLLGLASSGIHANGFSLFRRIVEQIDVSYDSPAPWNTSMSLGEATLQPTRMYMKSILPLLEKGLIKGCVDIASGGLEGCLEGFLPPHLSAEVYCNTWEYPPIFRWLAISGKIDFMEMSRTFNCGIGMVLVVEEEHLAHIIYELKSSSEEVYTLGCLLNRESGGAAVHFKFTRSMDVFTNEFSSRLIDSRTAASHCASEISPPSTTPQGLNPPANIPSAVTSLDAKFNCMLGFGSDSRPKRKLQVAVLLNSSTHSLVALYNSSRQSDFPAEISMILSGSSESDALIEFDWAMRVGIKVYIFDTERNRGGFAEISGDKSIHEINLKLKQLGLSSSAESLIPIEEGESEGKGVSSVRENITISQGASTRTQVSVCTPTSPHTKFDEAPREGIMKSVEPHGVFPFIQLGSQLEGKMHQLLLEHQIQAVCMCEANWSFSDSFLDKWRNRLLKSCHSLDPQFDSPRYALDGGMKVTGCTVFLQLPSYEEKQRIIMAQKSIDVAEDDTVSSLSDKIARQCETKCYPTALEAVVQRLRFTGYPVGEES